MLILVFKNRLFAEVKPSQKCVFLSFKPQKNPGGFSFENPPGFKKPPRTLGAQFGLHFGLIGPHLGPIWAQSGPHVGTIFQKANYSLMLAVSIIHFFS